MKNGTPSAARTFSFKESLTPFIRENRKILAQFALFLLFVSLGIWFITHERAELIDVRHALVTARWHWVVLGIFITCIYLVLQGLLYVLSFATLQQKVSLLDATVLFIKRNFISVFLPAGGISSLAFYTGALESRGIKKTQIHFASSIYGFVGILSVVILAVPAFIFALAKGFATSGEWYALGAVVLLISALFLLFRSLMKKGLFFRLIVKWLPSSEVFINDLQNNKIISKKFLLTILVSLFIDISGIVQLWVAMVALDVHPSVFAAVMGYVISVVFLIVSPFLRGLGAVELSMAIVLTRFGFGNVEAIAITFLYRFFEFWMPLLAGILAFLAKLNKLLMRVLPALFLMGLGILNIVSVLTPAISERLIRLKEFLPTEVIHASNYLVLTAGLFLLVTAAFMLKGMRTAWWFAIVLSILSFIGHITKAIDYEEASVALVVIIVLLATRKDYYVKTNPKLRNVGVRISLLFMAVTLTYGIIGFYLLDKKHFNIDFSFFQSIRFTLENYILIGSAELVPADAFARNFLYSVNISGFLSIAFLIYTLVRSYTASNSVTPEEVSLAKNLLSSAGNSALDYFKTYYDKMLFISENKKAFIAYRLTGNYAVALENPVAGSDADFMKCIREFDAYCYSNGVKSLFYRVPEESLDLYHQLSKKELFLGQEGIVDISSFSLEGGEKKSLRRSINKVTDEGYRSVIHQPPVKDGVLQKIKLVSDEWLQETGRAEIIFSQGMFLWEELKQQTILTVENAEEKIVAFLNIIPDFRKGEATYDLIRKSKDAPYGVTDFLLIELFNFLKSQHITHVNLGFAPLSGMDDPHTFPERSMKFAYEKIRSFAQYKGLRDYKEKFEPVWHNKYLIYGNDYDLLQVPAILAKVIKP